jgi:hypothetical protein
MRFAQQSPEQGFALAFEKSTRHHGAHIHRKNFTPALRQQARDALQQIALAGARIAENERQAPLPTERARRNLFHLFVAKESCGGLIAGDHAREIVRPCLQHSRLARSSGHGGLLAGLLLGVQNVERVFQRRGQIAVQRSAEGQDAPTLLRGSGGKGLGQRLVCSPVLEILIDANHTRHSLG